MPLLTVLTHIYPDWTRAAFGPYYFAWPVEVALSMGWEVEVVTTEHELPRMARGYDEPMDPLPSGARIRRFPLARTGRYRSPSMLSYLARHAGDVVHVHGYGYSYTEGAWLIAALRRRKLLLAPYYHPSRRPVRRIYDATLGRFMTQSADATQVFLDSTVQAMKHARMSTSKVIVLPLPLNPATHELLASGAGKGSVGQPTIIGVGGLVPRKSWDRVIRSLPWLIRYAPETQVVLAGYTTDQSRDYIGSLNALARQQGVGEHLSIIPDPTASELAELYSTARAFTFVSDIESFGLVLLEAMAARLPVVVHDTPGSREILDDTGIFVDADRPEDFGRALAESLNGSSATMQERASRRLAENYTCAILSPRLVALLNRVIS